VGSDHAAADLVGPGAGDRRSVVAWGHDDDLQVLWLRLDRPPDAAWARAFDQECAAVGSPFVRHHQHLLGTSTAEASRRLAKRARRLVGAANGRVSRTIDAEPVAY